MRASLPDEEFTPRTLAFIRAILGDHDQFIESARKVENQSSMQRINLAVSCALVDERDRCFDLLEIEYAEKNIWLRNINCENWIYDPLHEDPRFQSLVHCMGLDS